MHREVSPALAAYGPGLAYSRLLRLRSGPDVQPPSLEVECDLCLSWEQTSSTVYLFTLRSGVKWHNIPPVNGRELTAQDVAASFERMLTPGLATAKLLQNLASVTVVDTYTLKVEARKADADFLLTLADGHAKVLPQELLRDPAGLQNGPVIGTGPWIWVDDSKVDGTVLRSNSAYFEPGVPRLEEVRFQFIPDEATAYAAFSSRLLDLHQVLPKDWQGLLSRHPSLETLRYPLVATGLELALKTTSAPFDDLRARKSLLLSLDPWSLNASVWQDMAYVSVGMPVVRADWLLGEAELRSYLASPSEARALLSYFSPSSLSFVLTVADLGPEYLTYARGLVDQMRSVGFRPELKTVNPLVYGANVWQGGEYVAYLGPIAPMLTPNDYLLGVAHGGGRWNTHGLKEPSLDRLIEAQAVETDPQRRKELVLELQREFLDKAVRFLPTTRKVPWAWWPHVKGFYPNLAAFESFFWARIYIEK
ncbi:MAG: ABC transporter substrate-binding protein [Chloroflexi bacterium]|nr:ABC transporter substrate-binding protein [Chloroflexota bacterium]